MQNMTQKIVLITGATSGIGRHAALTLARAGHTVIATGRRQALLDSLAVEADGIVPLRLDVDDPAAIAGLAAEVDSLTAGHGIDILINNAGYATAGALAELPDDALRAQFETNVFGLMAVTRALLPRMLDRGHGRILNVSSVSGRIPAPLLGAYHASKYALEALSDALRMELAPVGIQVVIIEPGTIKSEFASTTMSHVKKLAATSRYARVYQQAADMEAKFAGMAADPVHVSRAIVRAIAARRPSARYVAPRRFLAIVALVRLLPTCLVDRIMRRTFGLTPANLLGPATE
jgi:short-subunit dehydrogenase